MADWSKPTLTSTYTNFLTEIAGLALDCAKGLDPAVVTVTNPPTSAIRWNSASAKWQKYSGTAWADLASSYAINIAGTVTAPLGTVSAPSIAFAGAATTGFYAPAADRVAMSIAGTQRMYVTAVGRFSFSAGTSPAGMVTIAGGGFVIQETGVDRSLSWMTADAATTYGAVGYNSASSTNELYITNGQSGGKIALKVSGSERFSVTDALIAASLNLQVASGKQLLLAGTSSATAPAIAHVESGNDTGIFFPADEQIAIAVAGLQITSWMASGLMTHSGAITASGLIRGNGGGLGLGSITVSTSEPSGGSTGDIWFVY